MGGVLTIAQQFAYIFPDESWGRKRKDPASPISADTMARVMPNGELYGVRVIPEVHIWGILPGQKFDAVIPVNHVGLTPPPVEVPPVTPPVVTPPPFTQPEVLSALAALMLEVVAAKNAAKEASAAAREAVTAANRAYEGSVSARWIGTLKFEMRPKRD
jgi:hypothetical protein